MTTEAAAAWRPAFWSPCGARPVPFWGSYQSFRVAFSRAVLWQGAHSAPRSRESGNDLPFKRVVLIVILLCMHLVSVHLTLKNPLVANDTIPTVHITPPQIQQPNIPNLFRL